MPSFDIVSKIETFELQNAIDNANRELTTRFDFRGVDASFELNETIVTLAADSEFQLQQMVEILKAKVVKRDIDVRAMDEKDIVHTGKRYSQAVEFKQGIDVDTAKSLVKTIKQSKMKVQSSIQGDQVRVTGKKRDDLQLAITLIKEEDFGQPFQYVNFRD